LQRRSRPEQSDQRQPNQAANISHQPRASPVSTLLASRIEFPTMTTAVYDADGEKIGSIERVMIEKISCKVSYAVLSFGGFLGFGDDYYPLPWPSLKYNVDLGGYQTMVPIQKLKAAPKYVRNASWDWDSGDRALDDYYGVVPT
jgi:hypothetical protein